MKIKDRYYFDFNATSPLCSPVRELNLDDIPFANPSSVHSSGKKSKKLVNDAILSMRNIFDVDESFDLVFHSGATEGINTFIKRLAIKWAIEEKKQGHFAYFKSDHSCVINQKEFLESLGHFVYELDIDRLGLFSVEDTIEKIRHLRGPKFLNYTYVNNETGVVWPQEWAVKIKHAVPEIIIHVDAVQAPGKIENWRIVSSDLDAFTYSGHKFGAHKGIGFSFIKNNLFKNGLMVGGGQQNGARSGTENILGILSLKLALEELNEKYSFTLQFSAKKFFENKLKALIVDRGEIVADGNGNRNGNTICAVFNDHRADILMTALDIVKVEVSSGSACSSGSLRPSKVLMAMGYTEEQAKSALRFSFSPYFTSDEAREYFDNCAKVLTRFVE